jgi:hypothetical protein
MYLGFLFVEEAAGARAAFFRATRGRAALIEPRSEAPYLRQIAACASNTVYRTALPSFCHLETRLLETHAMALHLIAGRLAGL